MRGGGFGREDEDDDLEEDEDEDDLNQFANRVEERADKSGSSSGVGTDPSEEDERESLVAAGSVTVGGREPRRRLGWKMLTKGFILSFFPERATIR